MKSLMICSTTLLAAVSLAAADKDDVTSAAQKLGDADNYSWTTTTEGGQNNAAPSHGKIQKDGLTWIDMTMRDNTTEAFAKAGKAAVKTDDGWETVDLTAAPQRGGGGGGGGGGGANPARFIGMRLRNLKAPAAEVADLVGKTKDLTKADDAYSGDLTEEGAKSLLTMGGGRRGGAGGGGGQAPTVSDAKGSVKIWIKDGVITKYQVKVSGTVTRNGNDRDVDRTTTVEIKDIGATKITVPDDAKSKLS
ncbi:MAG TPA: hypothetical protein VGR14_22605 [Verrucomicrobiae bacterium]|nr:hypothetical protein [Verrucomicrobiae bacterium]